MPGGFLAEAMISPIESHISLPLPGALELVENRAVAAGIDGRCPEADLAKGHFCPAISLNAKHVRKRA
jgi:hypothetical protein